MPLRLTEGIELFDTVFEMERSVFHDVIRGSKVAKSRKAYLSTNVEMLARSAESWFQEKAEGGCDHFAVAEGKFTDDYVYGNAFVDAAQARVDEAVANNDDVLHGFCGYSRMTLKEGVGTLTELRREKTKVFKALDNAFLPGGGLNPRNILDNIRDFNMDSTDRVSAMQQDDDAGILHIDEAGLSMRIEDLLNFKEMPESVLHMIATSNALSSERLSYSLVPHLKDASQENIESLVSFLMNVKTGGMLYYSNELKACVREAPAYVPAEAWAEALRVTPEHRALPCRDDDMHRIPDSVFQSPEFAAMVLDRMTVGKDNHDDVMDRISPEVISKALKNGLLKPYGIAYLLMGAVTGNEKAKTIVDSNKGTIGQRHAGIVTAMVDYYGHCDRYDIPYDRNDNALLDTLGATLSPDTLLKACTPDESGHAEFEMRSTQIDSCPDMMFTPKMLAEQAMGNLVEYVSRKTPSAEDCKRLVTHFCENTMHLPDDVKDEACRLIDEALQVDTGCKSSLLEPV